MKIIISHDVDHLSVKEHVFKDLIIPKFFVWQFIEFYKKNISLKELLKRYKSVFLNKWNNIKELQEFNLKNGVKATYFFGMDNALGLSYKKENTKNYIKYLLKNGADVGVHGINFDNKKKITKRI